VLNTALANTEEVIAITTPVAITSKILFKLFMKIVLTA